MSGAAIVALLWSTAGWTSYHRLLSGPFLHTNVHDLAANGLMTIFFATLGMELARERHQGLLADHRMLYAPVLAAVGGMGATAIVALGLGAWWHVSPLVRGWGIPMATDVAFVLGALALVGPKVPRELRVLLLTLAIADDVGSVIVLAVTGVTHVRWTGLLGAAVVVAGGYWWRRRGAGRFAVLVMVPLWACLALAHVDPALAGVVGGALVSFSDERATSTEATLSAWSAGVVLPLFALVACGVHLSAVGSGQHVVTIITATVLARVVGKIIGVLAGLGLARAVGHWYHRDLSGWHLLGAASLCAMGFTVPLLFDEALFANHPTTYGAFALGLLIATVLGGLLGVGLLRRTLPRPVVES